MKILIVTNYLDNFAGTELFVLDLSKKLLDKGHSVAVFSPILGGVAEKIKEAGIDVTDDLLSFENKKFDIIHAQHNATAIMARSIFPETPMIFMSHGILPATEQPPSIDIGIARYIVISEELKEHFIKKYSIPANKIKIIRNSINLDRFYPKKKVNKEIKKVLIISNRYTDDVKETVDKACLGIGAELNHVGLPNNPVDDVLPFIQEADLVVTLGRGVLEALACERNVIIYDVHGGDGFVDEGSFYEVRKNNFSGRRYGKKYTSESLKKELCKYDPTLGKKLREILLKEHSLDKVVDEFLEVYKVAKKEPAPSSWGKYQLYNELNFLEGFLGHLEKQFKEHNLTIKDQGVAIDNQRLKLDELNGQTESYEREVNDLRAQLKAIKYSKFWKLRGLYVRFGPRRIKNVLQRGLGVLKRDGLFMFVRKLWYFFYFKKKIPQQYPEYQKWIKNNENITAREAAQEIESFKYNPKISIIVPVYNVEPKWLNMCIGSVRRQYYKNWELCIHDDASTKEETIQCLKSWKEKGDSRIKISFGKKNQHISGASNDALKLATGEFVALLDNDDELASFALYENVKLLNEHKDADFIYSDEDKMDGNGKRWEPFFKPDWSPELMLSQMYTCHLGVYRKSIIDKIGGFRKGYEGAQDYDLVLRFIEHTKPENIFHISKVLYHWRAIETSTAMAASTKDYASVAAKKALDDYLKRNMMKGKVLDGPVVGTHRVKLEVIGRPMVSIIIPFRDHVEVLRKCVQSIFEKTVYDNYEIVLVDNQSQEKETEKYLNEIQANPCVRILRYDKPFCYSAINNFAVNKSSGEYVLLLNNDTEVITGGWLEAMLELAQKDGVGAVGAKLLYPNDRIQHAGIILGTGIAGHAFKGFKDGEPNFFKHADVIKNYSGVTAACLMTGKKVYEEVGGLNERDLKIAYNDVDFCLKLLKAGFRNVYTPYAKLYHYESFTRGDDEALKKTNPKEYKRVLAERKYMDDNWAEFIKNDPYYSPNLTRKHENFGINTDFSK